MLPAHLPNGVTASAGEDKGLDLVVGRTAAPIVGDDEVTV